MSRGIISIHVGSCGNKIGSSFWDMITKEHSINQYSWHSNYDFEYQRENVDVYYNETLICNYIPRAIFVDLDKDSINNLQKSTCYDRKNIIFAESTIHNNWAAAFYNQGKELIESITEAIRYEAEACDSLLGFHLFHSLGGGTGSGLGSLILNEIHDEYPDQIISTFSIFPSKKINFNNCYTEPYNCILSLNQLDQTTDEIFYFDNEKLYDTCFHKLKICNPLYNYLNYLILCPMSSITSSLRFPNQLNSDLRKIYNGLISFPRLKFINSTFLPCRSPGECVRSLSANDIKSFFIDKKELVRLSAYINLNGNYQTKDVNEQMEIINSKEEIDIKASICKNSIGLSRTATLIENSTEIKTTLERQKKDFNNIYKKRSFIQYYINEGLEIAEFDDANMFLTNLIQDYEDISDIDDEYYI